jgi:hypothetical protein
MKPARHLIICDFDRTLFDSRFYTDFTQMLVQKGYIDENTHQEVTRALDDTSISLSLTDILAVNGISTDRALELAAAHLNPADYLYPDVPAFLRRHQDHQLHIITTGQDDWQRVKLGFCTPLNAYPQTILQTNKGRHILSKLNRARSGITLDDLTEQFHAIHLIDDRVDNLLPLVDQPQIQLWHILRPGAKYQETVDHSNVHRISSLDEIVP